MDLLLHFRLSDLEDAVEGMTSLDTSGEQIEDPEFDKLPIELRFAGFNFLCDGW